PLIDQVQQGLRVIDQDITHRLASLAGQFDAGDPVWVGSRRVFLPEVWGAAVAEALRQPFQRGRPVPEEWQQLRGNAPVEFDYFALGDLGVGIHDLVEVHEGNAVFGWLGRR